MLELRTGDLFESGAQAIVNPVNCVGVMGRGLALEFKKRYPANFKAYQAACKAGQLRPGQLLVHKQSSGTPQYIINFPTKDHWKGASRMSYIVDGLKALVALDLQSVALPPIGCGLGGLEWTEVLKQIRLAFEPHPQIDVYLYRPQST